MAKLVRIGEVAHEVGVSVARLRQWADNGVIPSERSSGGHRTFDVGQVRAALARLSLMPSAGERWSAPGWETTRSLGGLDESEVWRDVVREQLQDQLSPEARSIASYAFTEMLNNAIDHSGADAVHVSVWISRFELRVEITDRGLGALPHLKDKLQLEDLYDALGELTKGRVTTDPDRHTGEGIFFTSKSVDVFSLESGSIRWTVDNLRGDTAVGISEVAQGTRIRWEMDPETDRSIAAVFRAYTDDDFQFARTRTTVSLFGIGVRFVSRSEAKRIMRGLERFEEVLVDFSGVEEVGQGFVDEVFRVWPNQNPGTSVAPVNMNEAVEFMVRRGLPRPR